MRLPRLSPGRFQELDWLPSFFREERRPSLQSLGIRRGGTAESLVWPLPRGGRSGSGGALAEKQLLDQHGCAAPAPSSPAGSPFSPEGPIDVSYPVTVMVAALLLAPRGLMPSLLSLRMFPCIFPVPLMHSRAGKEDWGWVLSLLLGDAELGRQGRQGRGGCRVSALILTLDGQGRGRSRG